MAGSKIKGINIKIGADSRGLDTALKGIEAKSKSATDELKEINRTIKATPQSLTAWRQKQEVLTKAIGDSREKVKLLEDAQEQVAKQLADKKISGEQYRAFQRELENARAESAKLNGEMQETRQKIRELGRSAEDTSKDTDKLSDSMDDTRRSADNASDGYTVFKNVLANLATQGINFAFDKLKIFTQQIIETGKAFEASLSNVQAISGATGDEMGVLSEKAKQMGATTKYTASQAADAFGYMALAGWKTQDMLAGIDGVLNLAAGSNMDLALASDIVTDYLTAFGLTAQDSGHFVDMMSYAMSRSNTTTELLGEAYKNCAATAASMGYSAEETTAVLMTMANAGVKGGEAGTALNAIMTRLATDTKNCASELEKYDVHVYDTEGSMNSLSSILQGVSGVWTTLTDQQQANLAKMMAGVNHYSALQTIMNGLSDSAKASGMSFTDYAAALEECDGTAQNMANTMIDNLAGDMTILDSAIDGVKIALSEKLNPILRDLVQYITEKMPEIQESSEKALDTVIVIAEWCRKNMPEIKKVASDILPIITGIGSSIAGWAVSSKIIGPVKKLFTALKSGTIITKLLNTTMLANPAVLLTTAIVGLTGAIVAYNLAQEDEISITEKVNEKYKDQIRKADDIKEKIDDLKDSFYDSADAIDIEFDRVKDLWNELDILTDSNGKVLDSDKKRAEYILGELNNALGTEYSMTGNQITNYQTLSKEIDNVIDKKQAEALLDAYLANSAEMAEEKAKAYDEYIKARKEADITKSAMDEAERAFKNTVRGTGNAEMTAEEISNEYGKKGSTIVITDEQFRAAEAYLLAKAENEEANDLVAKNKESYDEISDYQERPKKAWAEMEDGNYNIEKILYADKRSALDDKNATEDEKITAYNEKVEKLKYGAEIVIDTGNQADVDSFLQDLSSAFDEGQIAGLSPQQLATPDFVAALKQIIDKEFNISEFTAFGKDSGIDITKFLGNDFSEIFSKQVEKGYNVDDLLEWVAASNKKIDKKSWGEIEQYVDKQLEEVENYDLTPFLERLANAGVDIGEAFGGDYMGLVQDQIDEGFDPTELIKWFADTDKEAAESFKKNYKELSQKLLDNGYDPTKMLEHFAETDKKFADDFKKNGIDVIQAMLDKGFDFTKLTESFGIAINDIFNVWDEGFRKRFQKILDVDIDSGEPSFFEWGNKIRGNPNDPNDGLKLSYEELIGENFEQYFEGYKYYLDLINGRIHNNSAWDYELDQKRRQLAGLSRYATGGYISAGNKGIVAEAGPELLEVMNGGIRVTPLHRNSGNTSDIGSDSSQKIFYNTYNINNPKMSSNTDIRTIAQKLAAEQRRIEIGRGLR